MPFIEMDPELALKAIEGFDDELAPAAKKLNAFYRQFSCKRCGSTALSKEIELRHTFSDQDEVVPRSLLRCSVCNFLFDPHTGIVLEIGRDWVPILDLK
jgi:hypothetical protein